MNANIKLTQTQGGIYVEILPDLETATIQKA